MTGLLNIVSAVDNFTYGTIPSSVFKLVSHDEKGVLGYVLPLVVEKLMEFDNDESFIRDEITKTITINPTLDTLEARNARFASIASKLRDAGVFETLKGWRNELYTVYYPSHTPYLLVERAFCPLLGVVMYGIHINGYIPAHLSTKNEIEFWVPRRSTTKATFPGMLDNTIAGGIGHPYGVWETAIKESYEEAGISESYLEANITQVGAVSYIFSHKANSLDSEDGLIQPELEYIFDLVFDSSTVPRPVDHEAEYFELLTLDEVMKSLLGYKFKPNCALVMIDFLMRHGIVTPENEPDYLEINQRLHRRLPFALK